MVSCSLQIDKNLLHKNSIFSWPVFLFACENKRNVDHDIPIHCN